MQRIKGALDARIAEEQARQRASGSAARPRSGSTPKRSNSRNLSPSKRPANGESPSKAATGKGIDPAEFVIGDDEDQPSRTATPRPKEQAEGAEASVSDDKAGKNGEAEKETKDGEEQGEPAEKQPPAPEMSPETKARLRKLDKMEPKYSGEWT